MTIPPGTIGFGAVVLPHLNEYQGFYIVDDPEINKKATLLQMTALATSAGRAEGAIQAVLVESIITKNETLSSYAGRALYGVTKEAFFWIEATREGDGTRTEMHVLEARSIQAAQIEINSLPLVLGIKKRNLHGMMKRKQ